MSGRVVFLDTETTGLDPASASIFEVAIIEEDCTEHVFRLKPKEWVVRGMNPRAAQINRYADRTSAPDWTWDDPITAGDAIFNLLDGAHIVGAVPDFDTRHLTEWFDCEQSRPVPKWHYHLIDVEVLAVGYLAGHSRLSLELPWSSDHLSLCVGVNPPFGADRHTALGDARWAKSIWDTIMLATSEGGL